MSVATITAHGERWKQVGCGPFRTIKRPLECHFDSSL